MRKPYYRKDRGAWYVKTGNGRSQIRLHEEETKAYEVWRELQQVGRPDDLNAPLFSLAENFLAWAEKHIGSSTYDAYVYYLADFCNVKGHAAARTIKPHDVTKWMASHTAWGVSSQRAAITAVKRCFSWAVDEGLLEKSPIAAMKRPAANRREQFITDEQHVAMMQATDGGRTKQTRAGALRAVLIALRHSGARPGTVAAVTSANVSPAVDAWVMKKHKTRGKTGKPLIVWLSPCLQTLTRIVMAARPDGPLFINSRGVAWSRNAIRCRMRNLREKLNLPPGTVAYGYRHGYTMRAILAGNDVATVAELMGHSDVSMIARHYGHLDQAREHLKKAARKVI